MVKRLLLRSASLLTFLLAICMACAICWTTWFVLSIFSDTFAQYAGASSILQGSSTGTVFVDQETPSGAIDGQNTTFGLSAAPNPASSLHLFRNGILQKSGTDYSFTGTSIVFVTPDTPTPGDILTADYRH